MCCGFMRIGFMDGRYRENILYAPINFAFLRFISKKMGDRS